LFAAAGAAAEALHGIFFLATLSRSAGQLGLFAAAGAAAEALRGNFFSWARI
jgi:hypothetical protein